MTYNLELTDGELCELLNLCSARRRELGNKYHIEPAADLRSLMHKALVAYLAKAFHIFERPKHGDD